jgi:hypothetical protein
MVAASVAVVPPKERTMTLDVDYLLLEPVAVVAAPDVVVKGSGVTFYRCYRVG